MADFMKFNRIINKGQDGHLPYVCTVISFLFLIFYFLFFIFQSQFRFPPPVNKDSLNPFVVSLIGTKGFELYILSIGSCAFLFLSYLLITNESRLSFFNNKTVQIILLVPILIKIFTTNPRKVAEISSNFFVLLIFLILVTAAILFVYKFRKTIVKLPTIYKLSIWSGFTLFTILTTPVVTGSTTDFNFFIAPALKLIDGEKLGSFYLQYSLGETFLFKYMLLIGLKIHQMQILLGVIFSFWFLLYYFLATKLFKEKYFVILFLISLVLFKLLASPYHPFQSPQAITMRFDLWLPLFLTSLHFKIASLKSAAAFSLAYVFDNLFGFAFLGVYLLALFIVGFSKIKRGEKLNSKAVAFILAPIVASLIFQYHYFHSLFSSSGKLVNELNYWQMNISPHSMFWPALLVMGFFVFIAKKEKDKNLKENYFLLLGLALTGLTYFFGRSHENNLMTTSGILLVILFMCLDKLYSAYNLKKFSIILAGILVVATCFLFSSPIFANVITAYDHLKRGVVVDKNPIDVDIDNDKSFLNAYKTKKIYFISGYDAYLNYRYGLKQVGYYTPFIANLFVQDTVNSITQLSNDGYVILVEDKPIFTVEKYNHSVFLKEKGLEFELRPGPNLSDIKFFELNMVKR